MKLTFFQSAFRTAVLECHSYISSASHYLARGLEFCSALCWIFPRRAPVSFLQIELSHWTFSFRGKFIFTGRQSSSVVTREQGKTSTCRNMQELQILFVFINVNLIFYARWHVKETQAIPRSRTQSTQTHASEPPVCVCLFFPQSLGRSHES